MVRLKQRSQACTGLFPRPAESPLCSQLLKGEHRPIPGRRPAVRRAWGPASRSAMAMRLQRPAAGRGRRQASDAARTCSASSGFSTAGAPLGPAASAPGWTGGLGATAAAIPPPFCSPARPLLQPAFRRLSSMGGIPARPLARPPDPAAAPAAPLAAAASAAAAAALRRRSLPRLSLLVSWMAACSARPAAGHRHDSSSTLAAQPAAPARSRPPRRRLAADRRRPWVPTPPCAQGNHG